MLKPRLNLLKQYDARIAEGEISDNPQQRYILSQMEACYLRSLTFKFPWQKQPLAKTNVYIYGTVGSGKTYVMDMFFASIPHHKKLRMHFHEFLEKIATALRGYQGCKNPMHRIVNDLAKKYQVICLDEMMVQDVVQAMLLLELIPPLMSKQVMLVFTSNIEPQQLYLNGLQRERFLVVINHILTYSTVIGLSSNKDYRQQKLPYPQQTYFLGNDHHLKSMFLEYVLHFKEQASWQGLLTIQHRQIPYVAQSSHMIWFDFCEIAEIPRCQRDYLELVQRFKMVFITKVPAFKEYDNARVILWMLLIDVFYNARIKLIVSAEVPLEAMYPKQGPMYLAFQRTISRMKEMQSLGYWQHP